MRKLLAGGIVAGCFVLGACGGQPPVAGASVAGQVSAAVLPPDDVAKLQSTCKAATPLLTSLSAPGLPASVTDTALPASAYCQQLAAAPAGQVPPTTDSNTPSWLPGVLAATQTAAQIAGYVLPMVLPLL